MGSTPAVAGTNAQSQQYNDLRDDALTGWTDLATSEVWSYASVSGILATVNVPAGGSNRYAVGDRVRLKQGGSFLYFVVAAVVSDTQLTITGGNDYTLTNNPITNIGISKWSAPLNFPFWFNFIPTFTGFASNMTFVCKFCVVGRKVTMWLTHSVAGTSNATDFTITLPIARAGLSASIASACTFTNGGSGSATPGRVDVGPTTITLSTDFVNTGWIASNNKGANFIVDYDI